jgi:poly-gamma-glutamate synthesis protein (capsule biosynthesis protein)
MSVANNHALDYTRQALEDTFLRLEEAKIDYVGGGFNATEAGTPVIKEVNGTKIAFLAYTNLCPSSWKATKDKSGINCVSLGNSEKMKEDVAKAKMQSDIVIVSVHAGEEYTQELNQFQTEFSKAALEAGADIIIGHHPHVVQKHETSQINGENKWIFYSLGNFVFDQSFSTSTMSGQMVKATIEDKKIKEIKEIKTIINSEFQPEIER